MTKNSSSKKIERQARLRWVPLGTMRVSSQAQRDFSEAQATKYASDLDMEKLGFPLMSHRHDHDRAGETCTAYKVGCPVWIVDGQNRCGALRLWFGDGWETQQVQCEMFEGLTEPEEADLLLGRDDRRAIDAFTKFRIGLVAGYEEERDIERQVLHEGLVISKDEVEGAIKAVGTLRKVYRRSDAATLGRALRIIRDAFGDSALTALPIDGVGHVVQRYNGELDDARAVERLGKMNGGVNGLLGLAEQLHKKTGNAKGHCVAAAAVEVINRGKGGRKLPSWWADN